VLPALSGIAKVFQRLRPEDQYLADLWKSRILDDLAWHVAWGVERQRRREGWRAPTWSCASVSQVVNFSDPSNEPEIYYSRLVCASTTSFGDPTGEVSSGSVVLHGPAKMARVVSVGPATNFAVTNFAVNAEVLTLYCSGDFVTDFQKGKVTVDKDVLCLRLKTEYSQNDILLLLVAIDSRPSVYERIDLTSTRKEELSKHWFGDGNNEVEVEII
jgi:hypothetical protein